MRFRAHFLLALSLGVLAATVVRAAVPYGLEQAPTKLMTAFPDGVGKDVAARICTDCHPVSDVARRRESRFRWGVIIEKMIGEGAKISDEEFEVLVSYFSVALGKKVKINEATATVISETFDFEMADAETIVTHRAQRGPFKTWQEIASVPGIDAKRVEEQKGNLDFSVAPGIW